MRRSIGWYPPVKRLVDVVVAGLAAVPAAVAVGALSIGAAVTHGRPVFFRQVRVGRDGRQFTLVKLRTMRTAAAEAATAGDLGGAVGRAFAEGDRITGFGRFLRRTHLDELPQLVHVLRGDMTLVGPRPLAPTHVAEVAAGRRSTVRPGFTCYAQLELVEHGYLDKHRQIALDEEYVHRMGPRTDAAILWRTVRALFGTSPSRPPLARYDPDGAGWPPDRASPTDASGPLRARRRARGAT
jgi:lipopolysaccharide/colanic/teichoic acid biosynthesis glycosyltransferase